jgi:hypothetical protein
MIRVLHISLWLLIICNFCAALIILCAPYAFTHWIESLMVRQSSVEASILDKGPITTIPSIRIDGPISGQSEIVKREP